jgi:enolase
MKIVKVNSLEVLDSRGEPTIETEITLSDGSIGRAIVPSGASTGKYEALELRDGDKARYLGKGVLNAVKNVNSKIAWMLVHQKFETQEDLDRELIELDGTENKSKLGANAILSVSLAFAWAKAKSQNRPLYEYIGEIYENKDFTLPRPMMNISNGGKHANWATDIQEYMIIPMKEKKWSESLRMCSEVYHHFYKLLLGLGMDTDVGNEGGFAPDYKSNEQAIKLIIQAIEKAGYKLGDDFKLGFDAAASEFYQDNIDKYELKRDGKILRPYDMVDWVMDLYRNYPVESFEDMFDQDDWGSWKLLMDKVGNKCQIVGDDLLVTNKKRIEMAIEKNACNTLLVKMNQIGTLTETLEAMKTAKSAGWKTVCSHRSGETEDVTLSHLVVGTGSAQIKCGAPSRSERVAKYNELLRIEKQLAVSSKL